MGGKIPQIKLTAQCLVHCAVYYCLFFIGTIIINHVWFQIYRCLKQVTACVLLYFFIALSARVFQGVHLQMCVEVLSRPRGSDTCVHIQLPPGANFNDHNTWHMDL